MVEVELEVVVLWKVVVPVDEELEGYVELDSVLL